MTIKTPATKNRQKLSKKIVRDLCLNWKRYVSKVIQDTNPEKIIVIGKGVYSILERELRQTNIPIHVQSQPQGIRTKDGITEAFEKYYKLCNE